MTYLTLVEESEDFKNLHVVAYKHTVVVEQLICEFNMPKLLFYLLSFGLGECVRYIPCVHMPCPVAVTIKRLSLVMDSL